MYAIIVAFMLFLFASPVWADPTITGASGTLSHGSGVTISGSGFGAKNPAAPFIWDATDSSSASDLDTHWPGDRWPKACAGTPSEATYQMDYRASFGGLSTMPHSNITKFISGAAVTCDGAWSSNYSNNLITTSNDFDSDVLYLSYYYRMGAAWGQDTSGVGDNLKEVSANGGDGTYFGGDGGDNYVDWCNSDTPMLEYPSQSRMRGTGNCSPGVLITNPMGQWIHVEVDWNTDGWIYTARDGSNVQVGGRTGHSIRYNDSPEASPQSISVGGYSRFPRDAATGNYRYWAGIYLDKTYSRVMLCNGNNSATATICEPQIPVAWATDSITVTVNQGAISNGTAYLFVFDSTNVANATGYEVTVGADAAAPTVSQLAPSTQQTCTSNPRNIVRTWTTSEAANCRIHATESTWASMAAAGTTGSYNHSDTASQACGATYTPYIVCQDAAENESTASQMSYSIAAEAASGKSVTIGTGPNNIQITGSGNLSLTR